MGNQNPCADKSLQENQNSLENITKGLYDYATKNCLILYKKEVRQAIEKLYVLNQMHISDRIISLLKEKKEKQCDQLLKDLAKIDLQEFDELCHITQRTDFKSKKNANTQLQKSSIAKISKQFINFGEQCIRNTKFAFVLFFLSDESVEENFISQTDFPSRKSKLQIFMDKIEALKNRFHCFYDIYVICKKKKSSLFEQTFQQKINIIVYEPNQPCFSSSGKIKLFGNHIQFHENEGDMIHFLLNHSAFKDFPINYNYISFNNLNNFSSPALNAAHVGYLHSRVQKRILVTKISPQNDIKVQNGFIELTQSKSMSDILIKSSLLNEINARNGQLYQILAKKIKRKLHPNDNTIFYFSRLPQDILYQAFTLISKIPHIATDAISYSNFCKNLLGIENENQNDLVQICPSILHGDPNRLQQIKQNLQKKAEQSSFPIIIIKTSSE